jgi:hypothetical protein
MAPIQDYTDSLADSPRRFRLEQPDLGKEISNLRCGDIRHRNVANRGEGEHLECPHPLPLMMPVFPSASILIEDLHGGFSECRRSRGSLALGDRIEPGLDLTTNGRRPHASFG